MAFPSNQAQQVAGRRKSCDGENRKCVHVEKITGFVGRLWTKKVVNVSDVSLFPLDMLKIEIPVSGYNHAKGEGWRGSKVRGNKARFDCPSTGGRVGQPATSHSDWAKRENVEREDQRLPHFVLVNTDIKKSMFQRIKVGIAKVCSSPGKTWNSRVYCMHDGS